MSKTIESDHVLEEKVESDSQEARNFRLNIYNGIFVTIGFVFIDSSMVLAAFVKVLTGSNLLVGLTNSTMRAGWMWPQLFISSILEHRPLKMPFYILGTFMRIFSWAIIIIIILLIGNRNYMLLFTLFFIMYFISTSSMGVSTLPFNDIVAKEIPIHRRTRLFSIRQFIGGVFAIFTGFLIKYMLSDRFFLSFPYNYAVMFTIAMIFMTFGTIAFIMTKEPPQQVPNGRQSLWHHLKLGPHFLKVDRNYRYFMGYRILASFGNMGIPFYVPYALDKLGVHESAVGIFTTVGAISALLSNILWGYLGEKHGSRSLLFYSSILSFISPIIAASTGLLPGSYQMIYYYLVFITTQIFVSGSNIAYMTYNLAIAPDTNRPTYIGFLNTLIFPMSFVPFLAGIMLKIMSYETLFIISAIMSLMSVYFTFNLENVDKVDKKPLNGIDNV